MMLSSDETSRAIITKGITAVIRGDSKEEALQTARACLRGGITSIEVTWTIPEAARVLETLSNEAEENHLIGAGTIIEGPTAEDALRAGAKYIVGPNFAQDVVRLTLQHQVPYLPGCMTITEMIEARKSGADVIKLFPGSQFGPSFIKAVHGPMPGLPIMPTGGVSLDNVDDWLNAGAAAVGVGGEFTKLASNGNYKAVEELAEQFVGKVKKVKGKVQ
ncbi:bifunctional 2-keto-4-hydroxyglutarate aldolase/2-keto-3-deoxy-6-phosphogluconate aldolase [Alteribacillus sp. YIM 98480]|uniref:bifunctional 2-keto-4-hydroxyglutarate aldolase/2-keto-3-deoxy-6-phosphogluconate aldolase n=1 Tax=Alteribacillus sp. YIM 98480 TaxID=2606599 RepID=UPI001E53646D|nr:bifunctional 2-keto-4-hydroxyglutarate aldolase/2-keto-3-deoxy-6-phosphogluconate aldolase [Alteribacillus sp. YIM 98480]